MNKKENQNLFNIKNDDNEILIELNKEELSKEKTLADEIYQVISQLHTSIININNSKSLLKDAIEAADTNSTSMFIKRITNMQNQHIKYLEKLESFNIKDLTQDETDKINVEIEKNKNFLMEINILLEMANDSLINPEKYIKKFEILFTEYSKRKEKNIKPSETETAKTKEKYNKISIKKTGDIKLETNIKNKAEIKKETTQNNHKSAKEANINNKKTKPPLQRLDLTVNRKAPIKKAEKTPEKNIKEEKQKNNFEDYDFSINPKESNAKKLVEFYIEDLEND